MRQLARAKSRSSPPLPRASATAAWVGRWSAFVSAAVARAFAASLLALPAAHASYMDGQAPLLSEALFRALRGGRAAQSPAGRPGRRGQARRSPGEPPQRGGHGALECAAEEAPPAPAPPRGRRQRPRHSSVHQARGRGPSATPAGSDKLRIAPGRRSLSLRARLGGAGEGGHEGGVDSQLHALSGGQAIRHDLKVGRLGDRCAHGARGAACACDSRPGLPANPGSSSLKRSGSGAQGA